MESDSRSGGKEERRCRVVLVPEFKRTGELVLVNMRNLEVKCVKFDTMGFKDHVEP